MRYMLDTCICTFLMCDSDRISPDVRALFREEHMRTYARLQLNKAMDHKDPSDHVIISHAITERIPLISSDRKFDFYRNQGLDFIKNE